MPERPRRVLDRIIGRNARKSLAKYAPYAWGVAVMVIFMMLALWLVDSSVNR